MDNTEILNWNQRSKSQKHHFFLPSPSLRALIIGSSKAPVRRAVFTRRRVARPYHVTRAGCPPLTRRVLVAGDPPV